MKHARNRHTKKERPLERQKRERREGYTYESPRTRTDLSRPISASEKLRASDSTRTRTSTGGTSQVSSDTSKSRAAAAVYALCGIKIRFAVVNSNGNDGDVCHITALRGPI